MTFTLGRRGLLAAAPAIAISACIYERTSMTAPFPAIGRIERFSPLLDRLIDPDARIEEIAKGFRWTEGPTWDAKRGRLLFSDIPNNRIHGWSAEQGLTTVLDPAGAPHGPVDPHAAPGTNGLFLEEAGDTLLICNQDGRSVDRLNLADGTRTMLASQFEGKRLNSPNDVIRASDGTVYFTDPPYGLKDGETSAGREMQVKGVYALFTDGRLLRIVDDMTAPNGLALTPDGKTLIVSQSDSAAPVLRRFALDVRGMPASDSIWIDLAAQLSDDNPGLPDGMAFDRNGVLFATGPGGVFVIAPDGELLGRIHTGMATANCAFGEDGKTLFLTATETLLKLRTRTTGAFF